MTKKLSEISWVQKYRPPSIDHILMPKRLHKEFKDAQIGSHMLFAGTSGLGKTTLAKILAKDRSSIFLEAGINTGINDIRDKVIPFASTASLVNNAKKKVVIIDEASELSKPAQKSLKSVIEKYEKNVFFILTANHPENLDPNLKSRLEYVDFNFSNEESKEQMMNYRDRATKILQIEGGWTITNKALGLIFKQCYPDFRAILNVLYKIAKSKKINSQITEDDLVDISFSKDNDLFEFLVKEFNPHKIFQFVKTNYNGKEMQALQSLQSPFLNYLNKSGHSSKVLGAAVIAQKYGFEARSGSLDLMITLLACCDAMSKLFKS